MIVEEDGWILGDAAMHRPCLAITRRWCPYLSDRDRDVLEADVERDRIHADGQILADITEYGDQERKWALDLRAVRES
ncbi:hypothetical protein ACFVJR_27065 [Nocardia salmonicida]|uniref:hypothetical protein n=1 Tax=Nocardia salmonicida TaxID=53431 RepID=UPI00363ABC19